MVFDCVCDECENAEATHHCSDCEQDLCRDCSRWIHQKGTRALHGIDKLTSNDALHPSDEENEGDGLEVNEVEDEEVEDESVWWDDGISPSVEWSGSQKKTNKALERVKDLESMLCQAVPWPFGGLGFDRSRSRFPS